nr:hypothetical protein [uncultured bacterium]
MSKKKGPSAYQIRKEEEQQKEFSCGIMHSSLEEAMVHAERNLGFRDASGNLVVKLEPLLGGTLFSGGTVIGWQAGTQKRFRVDFEPEFEAKNRYATTQKNGVNKGTHGVHVNEEDFTRTRKPKICHPTESSLIIADLLWKRWSSRYGRRGQVTKDHIAAVDG